MNIEKPSYIFTYSIVMVLLVAITLTVVAVQLKPAQDNNIRIEKMQNILSSINIKTTPKDAEEFYKKYIVETIVINDKGEVQTNIKAFDVDLAAEIKKMDKSKRLLPVYIAKMEDGSTAKILPMRGKGLWGPIWGYISVKEDLSTVIGTMFDHKGETPGLGAEISLEIFQKQFIGKKILDEGGKFVSIKVQKGGAPKNDLHAVDAISGGTITSNGVTAMLSDCLSLYASYIASYKSSNQKEQ